MVLGHAWRPGTIRAAFANEAINVRILSILLWAG
jgi:hypothetical protein